MAEVQAPAFSALFGSEHWADVQTEHFPMVLAGVAPDCASRGWSTGKGPAAAPSRGGSESVV